MPFIHSPDSLRLLRKGAIIHGLLNFKFDNESIRPSHIDRVVEAIYEDMESLSSSSIGLQEVIDFNGKAVTTNKQFAVTMFNTESDRTFFRVSPDKGISLETQFPNRGGIYSNFGETTIYGNNAISFNEQYSFPLTDGNNKQVLTTNGGGQISWEYKERGGITALRPVAPYNFEMYFDTTLGFPVWYNGSIWVDATGSPA